MLCADGREQLYLYYLHIVPGIVANCPSCNLLHRCNQPYPCYIQFLNACKKSRTVPIYVCIDLSVCHPSINLSLSLSPSLSLSLSLSPNLSIYLFIYLKAHSSVSSYIYLNIVHRIVSRRVNDVTLKNEKI